jgi:putative membrane protein
MNTWWILRTELRRLIRSRIGRAAMLVGMVIPLLYSSLYLYAFWDPYAELDEFPVALVNLDQGGSKGGQQVKYGQDLVDSLLEEGKFKWHPVGAQEASEGLERGDYYLAITIPASFTEDILSVSSERPRKAELQFTANEGRNYIASTISKRLESTLREELGNKFTKEYVKGLFDVIGDAGNGLSKAAEAGNQLADGAGKVSDGIAKAADGATALATGAQDAAAGASQVAAGSRDLAGGLRKVDGSVAQLGEGAGRLQQGAERVSSGADQIANGLPQTTAGVKTVRDRLQASVAGTEQLQAGLAQMQATLGSTAGGGSKAPADPAQMSVVEMLSALGTKYGALSQEPLFRGALQKIDGVSAGLGLSAAQVAGSKQGLQQAVQGLDQVATHQEKMAEGARALAGGSKQLVQGSAELQGGLNRLQKEGTSPLVTGSERLSQGALNLAAGNQKLASGSQDLRSGLGGELLDGSRKLADGNRELAQKLNTATTDSKVANPDEKTEVMADPVVVRSTPLHPVSSYGMGFASYFVPLSLWVGALVLYFILSLREYRWLIAPVSSTSIVLGKFLTLALVGIGQAVISSWVLMEVLGLEVLHPMEFYLFAILFSLTSIAIIGLLIARLGTGPGRFIAILLLVLQLTSSAGTFPLEMVPPFFKAIHPFLPMTYGIEALRSIIVVGNEEVIWRDLAVISGTLLTILLVQIVTTRRTLRVKDLHAKDELQG